MPASTIHKIVVRKAPNYNVVQIHEVYEGNIGNKVQEIIDESQVNEKLTITISQLP